MEADHGLQEGLPYWDLSLTHPIQHLIMANMIRNILGGSKSGSISLVQNVSKHIGTCLQCLVLSLPNSGDISQK